PRRAVLAVAEAREELKGHGVILTAGVATGDAIPAQMRFGTLTEGGGDTTHSEATRLLHAASAGEVVLAPSTYSCVRQMCDASPISTDVTPSDTPYALEAIRRLTYASPSSLVGRERELIALTEAYDAALDGFGQIVTITGEAGVGKSRLVIALAEHAHDQEDQNKDQDQYQVLWLSGRADDLGENFAKPYGPFVDALDALGEKSIDGAQGQPAHVHEILRQIREDGPIPEPSGSGAIWSLPGALGLTTVGDQNPEEKHRAAAAVRDFILALVARGPVIIVLEDLHGADTLTTNMIGSLAAETIEQPLMIICVYRPSDATGSHPVYALADQGAGGDHTHIPVGALRSRDAERLLTELLPEDPLREQLQAKILEKTGVSKGGRIPLLLHSLVGLLCDEGKIYEEAGSGRWRIRDDIDSISLPENIQLVYQARFKRLEDHVQFLLEDASAIGLSFRRRLLKKIMRPPAEPLDSIGNGDAESFVRADLGGGDEYSFRHALMHESVYRTIPPEDRQRLHANIGAAIENLHDDLEPHYEDLARHYAETSDHAKAIDYLVKAARKASHKGDTKRAIALGSDARSRAQEHGADFNTRHALLQLLCWAYYYRTDFPDLLEVALEDARIVAEHYRAPVAELLQTEAAAAMDVLALAYRCTWTEHGDEEYQRLSHALMGRLKALEYSPMLRSAYIRVIDSLTLTARGDEAHEWVNRYAEAAKDDVVGLANATRLRGFLMAMSGRVRDAIEQSRKAIDLYEKGGSKYPVALRHMSIGVYQRGMGELQASKDSLETAVRMSLQYGLGHPLSEAYVSLGIVLVCLGDISAARNAYDSAGNMRREERPSRRIEVWYYQACVDLVEGKRRQRLSRNHLSSGVASTSTEPRKQGLAWEAGHWCMRLWAG
ncbi:MAG: AAA family ATPase, partial [Candidatus Latescibacteria bacterium]|nr:AAA family ATPase [Candidatus Latescibacterota bacterium]